MDRIVSAKELRASLPDIVRRVSRGESFTVVYRSKHSFRIVPLTGARAPGLEPAGQDPALGVFGIGCSSDGLTSEDHDESLYGKNLG